jgi:predicted metal-dependent HD superfamily phosphohydrolase
LELGRWRSLMARLGLAGHGGTYDGLCAAYAEAHRFYHTGEHIAACLRHLDEVAALAGRPDEVECALWFHDAVYATRASDNEQRSAARAAEFLRSAGAGGEVCDRVAGHIIATEHNAAPDDPDSALVVDIDLAILGSPPDAYRAFETNIRREYKWVPGPLFRRKRR